ncbi:MAG: hypothetical protein Tsb0016_17490 [Sphingomonadales bacterium]
MLEAVILSNGIYGGIAGLTPAGAGINARIAETGPDFALNLDGADLVIVPNGSDHFALMKARDEIARFLARGGILFCFDGWTMPWLPFHEWVMDNAQRTADVRYHRGIDRYRLLDGVDIDALTFRHGISGWWACGYIDPAPGADILLHDTWDRAIAVVDDVSTPGLLVLTASGPVGAYDGTDASAQALSRFYRNMLDLAQSKTPKPQGSLP